MSEAQTITVSTSRACCNCYFSSKRKGACQRFPLRMHTFAAPIQQKPAVLQGIGQVGGNIQIMRDSVPLVTPAPDDYVCGEHRYDREMNGWHFDDPA